VEVVAEEEVVEVVAEQDEVLESKTEEITENKDKDDFPPYIFDFQQYVYQGSLR
jgi:hypothetical protein